MKTNKEELKALAAQITEMKRSLKGSSKTIDQKAEIQSDLRYLRHNARERTIAQALMNRKIGIYDIQDMKSDFFEKFLAELGIEKKLRPDTERLYASNIIDLMYIIPEEEMKNAG